MKLLSSVRRNAGDAEPILGMRPNQIAIRIGMAARQAGLGEGYSGESPRLGMIQDLETLGVLLLGRHVADPPARRRTSAPRDLAWRLTGAAARRRTRFPTVQGAGCKTEPPDLRHRTILVSDSPALHPVTLY